jgi:hypothetical protein
MYIYGNFVGSGEDQPTTLKKQSKGVGSVNLVYEFTEPLKIASRKKTYLKKTPSVFRGVDRNNPGKGSYQKKS